jgi:hypothetical protein
MPHNYFNEEIKQSSDICLNCFARIRQRESCDKSKLRDRVSKTKMTGTEHQQTYSVSNSRSIHCLNCGSDRQFVERPVSISEALEYADNLSERINEVDGLEVNPKGLRGELRRLKADDTNQHEDNRIFSEAVDRTVAICD